MSKPHRYLYSDNLSFKYSYIRSGNVIHRGPYKNSDITCIGSAHTFGRYIQYPYPYLLQANNLGFGGIGCYDVLYDKELIDLINQSKIVIVQVLALRSTPTTIFPTKFGKNGLNGEFVEQFVQKNKDNHELMEKYIYEIRESYLNGYKQLLESIKPKKILLYFSNCQPRDHFDINDIFGNFPGPITKQIIQKLAELCDDYVFCQQEGTNMVSSKLEDYYYPNKMSHQKAFQLLKSIVNP
jgi:hypothetical protein